MSKQYTYRELIEAQLRGEIILYDSELSGDWREFESIIDVVLGDLDKTPSKPYYRIKPKTRVIRECNGYDLYPCETEPLKDGQEYYVPVPTNENLYYRQHWWNNEMNLYHLRCGFVYLNREDARHHADAMLHTCEVEEEIED